MAVEQTGKVLAVLISVFYNNVYTTWQKKQLTKNASGKRYEFIEEEYM